MVKKMYMYLNNNVVQVHKHLNSHTHFFNKEQKKILNTPQPLYSTIDGVQNIFRVSYPISVITRVKHIDI